MRRNGLLLILASVAHLGTVDAQQADTTSATSPNGFELKFWQEIKKNLQGGVAFFQQTVEGAILPSGSNRVHALHGAATAIGPGKLILTMPGSSTPDVTIKLLGNSNTFLASIRPGASILFAGVAESFAPDPFMLTFGAEVGDGTDETFVVVQPPDLSSSMPPISVARSLVRTTRSSMVSLDSLPRHMIRVRDGSDYTETIGTRLVRFLMAAGWNAEGAGSPQVAVQVEGIQSTLSLSQSAASQDGAWLVASTPSAEVSLVILNSDGSVRQIVRAIQRIVLFDTR